MQGQETTEPLLRAEALCVQRGGVPVLEGVTLSLTAGEALVLRGPNGIGKTTLLRCLAGLEPPVSGDLNVAPDQLAYSGHADGVKAALSVAENLLFWASVYGTTEALDAALDAFEIAQLRDRPAQSLSAGQKRRLGLARMVISGRAIWMLDEPTVSLDAASTRLFARAVEAHLAHGGAAIMATHIDLGLSAARDLELSPYRVVPRDVESIL